MNIKERLNVLKLKKYQRFLIIIISFVSTASIIMTSLINQKYSYEVGDIANGDIKATREVVDQIATEAAIKQRISEVDNQYIQKKDVPTNAVNNVRSFVQELKKARQTGSVNETPESQENLNEAEKFKAEAIKKLKETWKYSLSGEDYSYLFAVSNDELTSFENEIVNAINEVYKDNIEDGKLADKIDAQQIVDSVLNISQLTSNQRNLAKIIAYAEIQPNLFLDEEATAELKKIAESSVSPVIIKKNQIVVSEGEPITEKQLMILESLGLLSTSSADIILFIAITILVALILFLEYFYLFVHQKEIFNDNKQLILIAVILGISLILARSISIISPYIIPLALGPMLLTLLINYKVACILGALNCVLISGVVDFSIDITLSAVVCTIMGAIYLRNMHQRNDIMKSGVYIGLVSAATVIAIGFLTSNNTLEILKGGGLTLASNLFAGVLTIGLLPFFESTFDVVTVVKLLELSNPNNPLLKKILIEAPGTYNHSIQVANLAEMAAEEVGGNPVLARIASYYHDAGKTKRPYFFKENQIGRDNPHDKISPNLSTLIITSHVKDGLELAKEYNLPKAIQDVIEQHHGTTLVKYFYITMKNNSDKPEEVKEEDFRYPGPIPNTKESGIIMLADSVEAAVRSIPEPTKGKIEEMVNNIIKDKLNTGQLDDCNLTLKDINKIRQSFLKTLNSMYHSRIEYPSLKEQTKGEVL